MFYVYSRDIKTDKTTLIRTFDTSKDAIGHITWCYERDSGIGQLGKYYYFMVERKSAREDVLQGGLKMNLKELLDLYDMKTAQELIDYINYLMNVKEDYEILKDKVRNLNRFIDNLY